MLAVPDRTVCTAGWSLPPKTTVRVRPLASTARPESGSSAAPIVGVSPDSCWTASSAVTTTLVPASPSSKISSKAAKVVSVRM